MTQLRDYPLRPGGLLIPGNFEAIVRERGKIVPKHCRYNHNIWVDLGREYLARVTAPNATFTDHYAENPPTNPREFLQYIGVGIGGDSQSHAAAYQAPLKDDYPPGIAQNSTGNQQSDDDLTVTQLERPVKVNITTPIWLTNVTVPITFLNGSKTARYDHLFTATEINAPGPYTVVPISEAALFLSTQDEDAANVYDLSNPPTMIGAGRPLVMAYNAFEPVPKTIAFTVELRWELRF